MRPHAIWRDQIPNREKYGNVVWSIAYRPDGQQLVVAVGNRVLLYDANDGDLVHSLKGHRDSVYCVTYSKQGKRFASGGADHQVIIWTSKGEGILKYSHSDSIQFLAYNPVPARVLCISWTTDGLHLALGLFNGHVSIRDKFCAEKSKIIRSEPVWCLAWNPSPSRSESTEILTVGCWDQTLSFYKLSGQEAGPQHKLGYDPCSISFFSSGEYFALGGFDGRVQLWTRDGILLEDIVQMDSPVWSLAVHGLHKDRYAYRDKMTDVVLQHLVSDEKVRIRCKDHVKKIAVYRNRLVVQLPQKVLVYEVPGDDPLDMRYQPVDKVRITLDCSLLVATAQHFILCHEKQLQLYSSAGVMEREWRLDSLIRYIKVFGGVPGSEGILAGLKNGHIVKIFINSAFPITVIKQTSPVRCLDFSCDRKKLAIVNESATLMVYDLETQKLLYQEAGASSVAWNQEFPDMVAYSGNDTLCIKTGSFPPHPQKLHGFVVGFKGSKIFCLKSASMETVEIPQGPSLYRYLSVGNFSAAYEVACLGVTDGDWRQLALYALKEMVFDVARRAFIRIRDVWYLEEFSKRNWSKEDRALVAAYVLAYEGRFHEAAVHFGQAKEYGLATEMFTDLRRWDDAKKWADIHEKAVQNGEIDIPSKEQLSASENKEDNANLVPDGNTPGQIPKRGPSTTTGLMLKQAESSEEDGDLRAAADMYLQVGQKERAAALYTQIGALEPLIEIVRSCDRQNDQDEGIMLDAAACFIKHDHYMFAKEALTRAEDFENLISLHVKKSRWEEAFQLARSHPELAEEIYLPWGNWLISNDRYEEAYEAFEKAGRSDLSSDMLRQLTNLSAEQKLFKQAGMYS
ncbi:WD-repeat protein, putative [Perkinsus marinus ATCC 50983]|uniref:Intraflagellar transport protein 122 homolog n=1 Tax=Perkinsus marinus (strain ATCC 50983 / TXsc) TaxID=423536 RepID=C5L546_PERM5|nr:WD-repeat protein, putative [Perkinsus marinus ATCC 50983]EER08105.1 WD-repeat protein, putative [Perkinsus marinus ATCC 50983]|eukprot:XP_002776289.1 WD-repeat protein, putative [Perkinsus marinus ATCC 50983]